MLLEVFDVLVCVEVFDVLVLLKFLVAETNSIVWISTGPISGSVLSREYFCPQV